MAARLCKRHLNTTIACLLVCPTPFSPQQGYKSRRRGAETTVREPMQTEVNLALPTRLLHHPVRAASSSVSACWSAGRSGQASGSATIMMVRVPA